jgi:hypothetical protein
MATGKRKSSARRKAPTESRPSFLLEILDEHLRRADLSSDDRAHIQRWRKDERAERDWMPLHARIEERNPDVWAGSPRFVEKICIQDIITARRVADLCAGEPDNLLALSICAKSLAAYLKGQGPGLPPPEPDFLPLAPGLEALAVKLRQEAGKPQLMSRQDKDGSRRKRAFVLLLGHLFKDPQGKSSGAIHESIRVLAEIALDIELDSVDQIESIFRAR